MTTTWLNHDHDDDIALTGGKWVTHGLTMRWQPCEATIVAAVADIRPPKPVNELVSCPVCLATIAQPCRTRSGRRAADHPARIIPRRCPCGEVIEKGKSYCEPCRVQSIRESNRRRRGIESDAA